MKNFLYLCCVVFIFASCSKENEVKLKDDITLTSEEFESKAVPFFYVEKGDSITKDTYREKPEFLELDKSVVMFSTENKLKTTGASSGGGYITHLMISDSKSSNPPAGVQGIKIPVDLNEDAGGNWIYLYYSKGEEDPIVYLNFLTSSDPNELKIAIETPAYNIPIKNQDGIIADLNHRAGGHYVYGYYRKNNSTDLPIRDIAIVSGNSSVTYGDYEKIHTDLNKGAGGKYIYVFVKR
ncbi:hypothetical protein [Labilibaculum manganireducens]|uniref:hypothetical protein n=1 Tax=Labilibaculum manganireducens TaxID=1940525 RepID=UPI0029F5AC3A|nr:hypothetical protein [Labilibaculum manganireducens]